MAIDLRVSFFEIGMEWQRGGRRQTTNYNNFLRSVIGCQFPSVLPCSLAVVAEISLSLSLSCLYDSAVTHVPIFSRNQRQKNIKSIHKIRKMRKLTFLTFMIVHKFNFNFFVPIPNVHMNGPSFSPSFRTLSITFPMSPFARQWK